MRKVERLMHNIKTKILNIEIFDLQVDALQEELNFISYSLSNCLPPYTWNKIVAHHRFSFRNFHFRLVFQHRKKFDWLLKQKNFNLIKKITPIKFSCSNKEVNNIESIRLNHNLTSNQDNSNINIFIDLFKFLKKQKC